MNAAINSIGHAGAPDWYSTVLYFTKGFLIICHKIKGSGNPSFNLTMERVLREMLTEERDIGVTGTESFNSRKQCDIATAA